MRNNGFTPSEGEENTKSSGLIGTYGERDIGDLDVVGAPLSEEFDFRQFCRSHGGEKPMAISLSKSIRHFDMHTTNFLARQDSSL
jgi:hypothetical protein